MPTRLTLVVFDANDPPALARFWAEALGWRVTVEDPDEVAIEPDPEPEDEWAIVFVPVPEAKQAKNRVHLDIGSDSLKHQAAQVARLRELGATPADVGQGDASWVVLADPEGNEFCVLAPNASYEGRTPAAVVVDVNDPQAQGRFWTYATGWTVESSDDDSVVLRPPEPSMPFLDLWRVPEPKTVKNRVHLDVAPMKGEDHAEAVRQLETLGARPADVGQGPDVTWTVLTDPEGHEFCVLSPR